MLPIGFFVRRSGELDFATGWWRGMVGSRLARPRGRPGACGWSSLLVKV